MGCGIHVDLSFLSTNMQKKSHLSKIAQGIHKTLLKIINRVFLYHSSWYKVCLASLPCGILYLMGETRLSVVISLC